jgi:hypothetical protein
MVHLLAAYLVKDVLNGMAGREHHAPAAIHASPEPDEAYCQPYREYRDHDLLLV